MGRRKIEMKKIEDRQKRNVSFTKRRQGLFKKAKDLCFKTGADISLLVFSPGGNPFTFSSSSSSSLNDLFNYTVNVKEEVEVAGGDGFWWDNLNFEELDSIDKLTAVKNQLLDVKEKIAKRKQELLATATATPTTTTTVEDSMEDDLRKLLAEAFDDADNWLPSFDDSGNLFEGLDDIEKLPPLNDLEIDMVF